MFVQYVFHQALRRRMRGSWFHLVCLAFHWLSLALVETRWWIVLQGARVTRYNHRQRAPVFGICSWGFRVVFCFRQSACCRRHKSTIRTNLRNTLTEYQTTQKLTDSLENNKNNVRKELKVNEQTMPNTPMFWVWVGEWEWSSFQQPTHKPAPSGFLKPTIDPLAILNLYIDSIGPPHSSIHASP